MQSYIAHRWIIILFWCLLWACWPTQSNGKSSMRCSWAEGTCSALFSAKTINDNLNELSYTKWSLESVGIKILKLNKFSGHKLNFEKWFRQSSSPLLIMIFVKYNVYSIFPSILGIFLLFELRQYCSIVYIKAVNWTFFYKRHCNILIKYNYIQSLQLNNAFSTNLSSSQI